MQIFSTQKHRSNNISGSLLIGLLAFLFVPSSPALAEPDHTQQQASLLMQRKDAVRKKRKDEVVSTVTSESLLETLKTIKNDLIELDQKPLETYSTGSTTRAHKRFNDKQSLHDVISQWLVSLGVSSDEAIAATKSWMKEADGGERIKMAVRSTGTTMDPTMLETFGRMDDLSWWLGLQKLSSRDLTKIVKSFKFQTKHPDKKRKELKKPANLPFTVGHSELIERDGKIYGKNSDNTIYWVQLGGTKSFYGYAFMRSNPATKQWKVMQFHRNGKPKAR